MNDSPRRRRSPELQLAFARLAAEAALMAGRKPDPRAVRVLREHSDPLADAEPA